jgi:hypothetical protein
MSKSTTASEEFDPAAEAEALYERHRKIVEKLRKDWEDLGCPTTIPFGKQTIGHPILKELQRAEQIANQLLRTMRRSRPVGRPLGANSAPDRTRPRTPRIRMIER